MSVQLRFSLLFAVLLLLPPAVLAQDEVEEAGSAAPVIVSQPAAPEYAQDSLGRRTPRSSLQGFLTAVDDNDLIKAIEYLDLRYLPPRYQNAQPTEIARKLAIVIEREIWIDLTRLSDKPEGEAGDGLPEYRDRLGRIEGSDGDVVLLMQRVPDGEGDYIWKISNATVSEIADLYNEFGYGPLVEALIETVPDVSFLGFELFKWIITWGSGALAFPLFAALGYVLARIFSSPASPLYARTKRFFMVPISLLLTLIVMRVVSMDLGLGLEAQKYASGSTLILLASAWSFVVAIGLIRDSYAARLIATGREGAVVLLRPASQALQILLLLALLLVWIENLGFNITTILAGLGVGGIAVALALQKPLEDIFGALSLYTQQPMRIGDYCRIGADSGTVEEIGLRTTRIRTRANTLISIPNARMSQEAIDNYSARSKFLYNPHLRLRVDTPRATLERLLQTLTELVEGHEKTLARDRRVRFQVIGEDALEVHIFVYLNCSTYFDYLEIAEDLNLTVMRVLEDLGVRLAVPAREWLESQPAPAG